MAERAKDRINVRYEHLMSMIDRLEKKIKSLPEGNIYIKHAGKRRYYYLYNGDYSKEKLLGKNDKKLIDDLLQKKYLMMVLVNSKEEADLLKKTLDKYPKVIAEETFNQLDEAHKERIKPIVATDEQFVSEWLNQPYTPKPFKQGDSYFETLRGERVRSKSEVIIADRLFTNGIPYKYECPLMVGQNTIYPDFTLLRVSDRKILYLEHNGKVGDQVYGDDMVDRLNKYTLAGIYQGDRLFMTFESANRPLDVRVVDKMINDLFK